MIKSPCFVACWPRARSTVYPTISFASLRLGVLLSLLSGTVYAQELPPAAAPAVAPVQPVPSPEPAAPSQPARALEVAPPSAPLPSGQSTTVVAPSSGLEVRISAPSGSTTGVEVKVLPSGAPASLTSPPSAPMPEEEPPARFSVGAGLGFAGYGDVQGPGSLSYFGGTFPAAGSRAPMGTALLEYALSETWRLTVGLNGSFQRMVSGEHRAQNYPETVWSVGGTIGVRRVLNPGGVVEVSPILVLGAHQARAHGVAYAGTDIDGLAHRERPGESSAWG